MALPTKPATKGKSQRSSAFFIDIDTANSDATPEWLRTFGVKNFTKDRQTTLQENSDWDDVDEDSGLVWQSQVPTGASWSAEITFSDKDYGTTAYQQDPGQAFLLDHDGEMVHIRWYRRNGAGKVREGWAWVSWKETDNNGLTNSVASLTGDGILKNDQDAMAVVASAWAASHAYALGSYVTVTGGLLKATTAGTSAATVPTAPAIGATVTDGSVVWTRVA